MAVMSPDSPFYDGHVVITDHAADRWDERTSPDSVAPEAGWHAGTRLPPRVCGKHADEYRVYEPEAVVLARRDRSVVTVLATTGPDAERWLVEAVYEAVGNIWDSAGGHVPEVMG